MSDTKDRILDAAEMLFARQGVASTSLRSITQAAAVNGAAIHYHFGSKAELVESLIQRRIAPLNELRLKHLEQLEVTAQGEAVDIELLLSAFLDPVVAARTEFKTREPQLAGLFAWLRFEPGADFARIQDEFMEVRERFARAVSRACGGIDEAEADERLGYAVGATFHLLRGSADEEGSDDDVRTSFERLMRFLVAGFRAPASEPLSPAALPPSRSGAALKDEGVRV